MWRAVRDHRFFTWLRRYPRLMLTLGAALLLAYLLALPRPLFRVPVCIVLEDQRGELLGARIAADGQWRFPAIDSVPDKFAAALIEFEDRRFYVHPGVDPLALGRALVQNLRGGRIVSGGSTLSMQVVRMARGPKKRHFGNKLVEAILATRLELGYSKRRILALYASYAPFGGNVMGLEAAAWRYFGKGPDLLTWAEAATLAVLPNSPALIHPGRNRHRLLAKRNRLLDRLHQSGKLSRFDLELALAEPLPEAPHPLPQLAPHLLERARREFSGGGKATQSRFKSTIDRELQRQVNGILERHQHRLRFNEIHNIAALIIDVERAEVLAYCGNAPGAGPEHAPSVDIITAPRSTGSILKPFLYALALQEGRILPAGLLPDVPTSMEGFRPENYLKQYDGAVQARRALIRSLNVPMVHLLQQYGLEKFHYRLRQLGLSTITQPPGHYGLTLILGGAEATLWDLANAYAGMSRSLGHFYRYNSRYDTRDFRPANYLAGNSLPPPANSKLEKEAPLLGAGAIWFSFEAMQQLERPDSEGQWEQFYSSRRLAWKTGTSHGFRDAWAIGVTPRFVVAVWAGNADGEGRPGLLGTQAAAPALFDIVDLLPSEAWFEPPYDDMRRLPVCRQSGWRASGSCSADSSWVPAAGVNAATCAFHRIVHLSPDRKWQVNSSCMLPADMLQEPWFVLPPVQEFYYKHRQPTYKVLPPLRPDCALADNGASGNPMQLIYPRHPTRILLPVDLDGKPQQTVFSVAHRRPQTTIHWHLDNEFIGSTTTFHQMELLPSKGKHRLTLVDDRGNRLEQVFEIK